MIIQLYLEEIKTKGFEISDVYKKFNIVKRVCEIKSVNRHSMISDGAVSS